MGEAVRAAVVLSVELIHEVAEVTDNLADEDASSLIAANVVPKCGECFFCLNGSRVGPLVRCGGASACQLCCQLRIKK